jgi:hypothetical protein
MYRSTSCSFVQQVQNAAAAGAIAVVFIQNRPASEGWFPTEAAVGPPMQPIPAVMIKRDDGNALVASMATNTPTITINPLDYTINPPPALSPLGQADVGKGASDILFPVVVPTNGIYPLRLTYFQGGGGANCEFFSLVGTNRVLINDRTSTNGPALRAFFNVGLLSIKNDGVNITITYFGTLQSTPNLNPPVTWTDVPGSSPLVIPVGSSAAQQYYRARLTSR